MPPSSIDLLVAFPVALEKATMKQNQKVRPPRYAILYFLSSVLVSTMSGASYTFGWHKKILFYGVVRKEIDKILTISV